jgi:CHASE3 domain sensor protein
MVVTMEMYYNLELGAAILAIVAVSCYILAMALYTQNQRLRRFIRKNKQAQDYADWEQEQKL